MSNFNPIVMRQFYALLCLLLFSGACSEDDTPNPAVKFSSPDSDVKISQDGTSCAITATHHAGQFVLTMEKNFEAVPGIRPVVVHGRPVGGSADGRNRRERRGAAQRRNLHHERRKRHRQNHGRTRRCADPESGKQYGGVHQRGGGIDPITVTTNQERWDAACDAGWITISKEGDKLRLTASPNPDGGNRRPW